MRIYLAAPYTHPNSTVRLFRVKAVNCMAAKLLKEGHEVFSPLSMGHEICRTCELPTDFSFWRSTCLSMIEHWATHVYVLDLEGWEESTGVREEVALAEKLCLVCEVKEVQRSNFKECKKRYRYSSIKQNEQNTENQRPRKYLKFVFLWKNTISKAMIAFVKFAKTIISKCFRFKISYMLKMDIILLIASGIMWLISILIMQAGL